ncbi:hypothetical protein Y032_0002g908 [Ancylostoma ceylanicum]|uniref:Uncharacterized protein n=2 Tax=Ancylostoma ceylanicum TaxID=53326 RepID=A0A016W1C0_9BILA|nr:hypothetical protein Y032_0002g908 [Ancylostoma ceylanicum]
MGTFHQPINIYHACSTMGEKVLSITKGLFEKATRGLNADDKLVRRSKNSLKKVQMEVKHIEQAEDRALDRTKMMITKEFTNFAASVNEALIETAENMMITLTDMSPRCDSMMVIWNDIGWYMCHLISRPLSGIWMAIVVAAFSSTLISQALFDLTKYLKSVDISEVESTESETGKISFESMEPMSSDAWTSSTEAITRTAIEFKEPDSLNMSTPSMEATAGNESMGPMPSHIRTLPMESTTTTDIDSRKPMPSDIRTLPMESTRTADIESRGPMSSDIRTLPRESTRTARIASRAPVSSDTRTLPMESTTRAGVKSRGPMSSDIRTLPRESSRTADIGPRGPMSSDIRTLPMECDTKAATVPMQPKSSDLSETSPAT